ncbi:MAG: sensor histidine kinase [Bacteroidales bacterium]|nr:sensor histidine kinase [Bacteroidales bacterium]
MKEISLHILDLANNSITAKAGRLEITVIEDVSNNKFVFRLIDDGKGMDQETLACVTDPFVTSRKTRKVGLGLSLTKHSAEQCNGFLKIESQLGEGTQLEVMFENDHLDRPVLGDICGVITILLSSEYEYHLIYRHQYNQNEFVFDSSEIKQELGLDRLNQPAILGMLKDYIQTNIDDLYSL